MSICTQVCNGYAIYQVRPKARPEEGEVIESVKQERIASAIYATASLMNHSCEPNTINSYVGNLLIIRATKAVKEGQQVRMFNISQIFSM